MKNVESIIDSVGKYKNTILMLVSVFLLGAAFGADYSTATVLAVYQGTRKMNTPAIAIAAIAALGSVFGGAGIAVLQVIIGMSLLLVLDLPYEGREGANPLRDGLQASAATLSAGLMGISAAGITGARLTDVVIQSVVVFMAVQIIQKITAGNPNGDYQRMSVEKSAFMALYVAAAAQGLFVFGFSAMSVHIILGVIIQFLSFSYGGPTGAIAGLSYGILLHASNVPYSIETGLSYAIAGFVCGMFGKFGRLAGALGFVAGMVLYMVIIPEYTSDMPVFAALVCSGIVGTIDLLKNVIFNERIKTGIPNGNYSEPGSNDLSYTLLNRLKAISGCINEFSSSFSQGAAFLQGGLQDDMCGVLTKTANEACNDCMLAEYCWDKEFYETYRAINIMTERLQSGGTLTERNMPDFFSRKCERKQKVLASIVTAYEVFRTESVWKQRLNESKGLMAVQLENLVGLVADITEEITEECSELRKMSAWLEHVIEREFGEGKVYLRQDKKGRYDVEILIPGCSTFPWNEKEIADKLSGELDRKMVFDVTRRMKENGRYIAARFTEDDIYSISTGVAQLSKEEECGDCFTYDRFNTGVYLAGLSDGMGTGSGAAAFSGAAINLLEGLISGGVMPEKAVEFVNNGVLLQEGGDAVVTLDLALIDLRDGEARFLKIGAAPTVIIRETGTVLINTNAMFFGNGHDEGLKPDVIELSGGEIMVFMSDGVFDAMISENNMDDMEVMLNGISDCPPKEMADRVLKETVQKIGGRKDDMSVMVLKVYKRPVPGKRCGVEPLKKRHESVTVSFGR